MAKALRKLVALSPLLVFAIALWALQGALADYEFSDVSHAFHRLHGAVLVAALAATVLSFLALTGFDALAARHVGATLPFPRIALASFVSQSISNATGFVSLTGASIRYRIYSAVGLTASDVGRIVGFCTLTTTLGVAATLASAMLLEAGAVRAALHLPVPLVRLLGALLVCLLALYLWLTTRPEPAIKVGRWSFALPRWRVTLLQVALSVADISFAAAVLYVLLPGRGLPIFPAFVGLYAVALIAGVISHVPGGLGVFEGLMVLLLHRIPAAHVLSALVVYRLLYNVLPLAVAALILGLHELHARRKSVVQTARWMQDILEAVAPELFAVMACLGGVVLLWSAATPAIPGRMALLSDVVPLPVVEASHLLASVAGVWLLLLGRGLHRRLDGAYWLTCAVYLAGILLSLLKGFDWEEALLLTGFLVVLVPAHHSFYRKTSLIAQRFSLRWAVAIATLVAGNTWLALFTFKHARYSREMWWQFSFESDAPRALRAMVAAIVVAGIWFLWRSLAPARVRSHPADAADLAVAKNIVFASISADAQLALTGDKAFLFSPERDAFLMYAISGRSWVALGDPVGPTARWPDLIWQFRELVDRAAGWPVFYQVGAEGLHYYLDLGLSFVKLGEEARVRLSDFSLQGSARAEMRYVHRRAQKDGASFAVLSPDEAAPLMPELRAISDEWLRAKNTREKSFSLGSFDPAYLANFPMAIVRKEGRIIAFANFWLSAEKEEFAVDLMRHVSESGYGVMDYLFIEAMLWGQAQGFRWFSFGVAPLSGFRDNALAPLWNRVGAFLYRHGEDLYNFQGLRHYKEKFLPEWRPRFMAAPGGLSLPRVATDVATLISGGMKGLVMK
jgi:phosphatidylglycerol lysyltransferase